VLSRAKNFTPKKLTEEQEFQYHLEFKCGVPQRVSIKKELSTSAQEKRNTFVRIQAIGSAELFPQMKPHLKQIFALTFLPLCASLAEETKPVPFHETFGPEFNAKRFTTPIPNKNTEVRSGVLWTRGSSGGKYPPMVYLPVEGKDLTLSFRYRHLGEGGLIWFFVDGDDGFGSEDHMLRVKLLRDGVQLEVDGHSKNENHPFRQNTRPADKVSAAYRLNEFLPVEKVDLKGNDWRTVQLIFQGEDVTISIDGNLWNKRLSRPNFNAAKRKLLWMQNGGEEGIELDDINVTLTTAPR